MEAWIHLFDIFLNSPSPKFEASLWFSSNSINNSTTTTSTNSFLKLVSKSIDAITTNPASSSSPSSSNFFTKIFLFLDKFMYIQTLPNAVQSRILSFLTTESKIFCKRELCLLAESVLNGNEKVDFWVNKYAHNLLDKMSDSGFSRFSSLNLDDENRDEVMEVEELCEVEEKDEVLNQMDVSIDFQVRTKEGTVSLANEIHQIFFEKDEKEVKNSFAVLGLIELWEVDDETTSASKILCSIVLPKLLVLNGPASRVIVTTTVEFCKQRQKATVDALLFPLILRKEGLNTHMCDVMSRIIKKCLHPSHISAFCQRLLCGEEESRKFVCLPCHEHMVSDKLNISLTQDSINHIVSVVRELAGQYSKSLKFSTFLLCLITKCHSSLKHHKLILIPTVELIMFDYHKIWKLLRDFTDNLPEISSSRCQGPGRNEIEILD
ncbi:hypothetical protein MKX01_004741 [Papaver californicum]|nr:hypothetical protein MKX01_004741 [Papaver californicum]